MFKCTVLEKLDEILRRLTRIETLVGVTMSQLDDDISALTAKVAAQNSLNASATTLITGIPALVATAVAAAVAAGASPAQLAAITALGTSLDASSAPLVAALSTNTPVTPAQAAARK